MKRSSAFDLLCGICILRMMMLHAVCITALRQAEWWKPIMFWSFFFMSFFFFKAGYFNKGVEGASKPFCLDKAKRLMIPYLAWGSISFCINGLFLILFPTQLARPVAAFFRYNYLTSGLTLGNSPLWFLLCFFCAYIVAHFYLKALSWKGIQRIGFLAFPAISYWLSLHGNPLWFFTSNVFCGVFFFALGKEWHKVLDALGRRKGVILSTLLTVAFVYLNIHYHAEYEMRTNGWVGPAFLVMFNTALALTGISGLLLTSNCPRIPGISYIGQHSMVYYVTHYLFMLTYTYTSVVLGHPVKGSIMHLGAMLLLALVGATTIVPIVEKTPWLSGRWKPLPTHPLKGNEQL